MSQLPETFARLLTRAIKAIVAYECKPIRVVQDELGYALGKKGGASIERWRKGYVPAKTADIETLARQLVLRKGIQEVNILKRFLLSADYAQPQRLFEELELFLNEKESVPPMPTQPDSQQQNPFIVGPPITDPRQFFGRSETLERIFGVWQHPPLQNVAVIGLKRSGKTSLLHYLCQITQTPAGYLRPGQRNDWLPQPERYRWVFVDFQDSRMGNRERLLQYLLTNLNLPVPEPCDLHNFMDVVSERLQTPAIILMDEIGGGLESPELDRQFWNSLRSLGTNYTRGNLAFLLTAHHSPAKLAQEEGKTSPFFNIFGHSLHLGPLAELEARALIANSLRPFETDDIEWILAHSGRWPCILQSLCHTRFATLAKEQLEDSWREIALQQIEAYQHLLA